MQARSASSISLADLRPDHRPDHQSKDDRDRAVLLVGARADRAADYAAKHGADFGDGHFHADPFLQRLPV